MQEIIDKSHGWFRNWFRKVWDVRGGGLYAVGFALTFLYFEIGSLREDIVGIGGIFNGGLINFVIEFFIDSFMNTIKSFAWPVYVVQTAPPFGAIALGLGFVGFTKYLKPPITRWLFPDGESEKPEKGRQGKKSQEA